MKGELTILWSAIVLAIVGVSALLCAILILILRPLLARYAMARPNARSSHKVPTAQGGGFAVVATVIVVAYAAIHVFPADDVGPLRIPIICAAIVLMAGVGVIADIHPGQFLTRVLLQTLAVTAVVMVLPDGARALPVLPLWAERLLLVVGGVWFVNLVNFMDGLDWMTVAEVIPVTGGIAAIGTYGTLSASAILISLALCGAMIGFAFFNRPVAKLFLGDVGSLPIGLVVGWLLVLLAGDGEHAAATLLPLYYIADSSITLVRRAANGEKVWQAHRSHFYQRATERGLSVFDIVARVFAVNLALAALAFLTVVLPSRLTDTLAICGGVALVGWLLVALSRGRTIAAL